VIRKGCRNDDIIARLGGDEFVILLPNTSAHEAESILKRITDLSIREKVCNLDLSISFGSETKTNGDEYIQDIVKNAEDQMYRNKHRGSAAIRSKAIDLTLNTLYEKSSWEQLHSVRVSELCVEIASEMYHDDRLIEQIRLAGLMHDIGKIEIDVDILNKPNALDTDEWEEMKRHPEIGYRILRTSKEFSEIADFVLEHQERWDGKGYPRGLEGEGISLQARIIAVADSYDAMRTNRTYRKTLSGQEAVEEMRRCSGTQFDPSVVRVLLSILQDKAASSM
jgi:putative nucleotidyltransferase with HDIG domain